MPGSTNELDVRRDDIKGEAWLHGRFSFVLYRRPHAGNESVRS